MLMSARDFRTNLSSNMCCFFSPEENNLFPYPWSFCTTEKLEKEKDLWQMIHDDGRKRIGYFLEKTNFKIPLCTFLAYFYVDLVV